MARKKKDGDTDGATETTAASGLPRYTQPLWHYDLYALLEGVQEIHVGHDKMVNVNLVEVVTVTTEDGNSVKKCYFSPTKRRGIERRILIHAPTSSGVLLGEKLGCAIPKTCGGVGCPICAVFGALDTGEEGGSGERVTFIGRLTHGGGVAVQSLEPAEKQRLRVSSAVRKEAGDEPMPFKREYNPPGLLYPITNHAMSVTEAEFTAAAYAFLNSLPRLGAGNPKGLDIARDTKGEPLLVLDRYRVPLGKRPIISPRAADAGKAVADFQAAASEKPATNTEEFSRWIGKDAIRRLQDLALWFDQNMLQKEIPDWRNQVVFP